MNIIDYILLGYKNIWRRKTRSFLTIFAVVIGAISIVIMLSLVLGAKRVATQQLESIDGLTLISVSSNPEMESNGNLLNSDTGFDDSGKKLNDSIVESLKKIQHVKDATPIVGVWIKSIKLDGTDKKFRANIMAYNPDNQVLNFPITIGRALKNDDTDKIVIGNELLRNFGYSTNPKDIIGKKVILYTPENVDWGTDPPKPPENAGDEYWKETQKNSYEVTAEIIGVITNGPDESQNYISMNWGRRLMTVKNWRMDDEKRKQMEEARKKLEDQMNSVFQSQKQVLMEQLKNQPDDNKRKELEDKMRMEFESNISDKLKNMGLNESNFMILTREDRFQGYSTILVRVDNTANIEEVGKKINELGLGVQTAKGMLDQIEKIFNLVGMIIGAIGGIVLFVAALGIINNMLMATFERTREIGILRACGATKSTIRNMFIFEASTLGFLGGAIGLAISFGLAKILNIFGNKIALSQNVPINNLISFPLWLIIGVIALTTIIGTLSGLLPAIRASNMDPVEALRYE
jgi:putative ABC transport system permease protein